MAAWRGVRIQRCRLIEKKIDAVLLELNGIGLGFGHALHHFDFGDVHFVAARRARLGLNFAGRDHARFLGQSLERAEGFGIFLLRDDSLDHAGAVAKNREEEFARFAQVVEPAANFYGAPNVLLRVLDGNCGNGCFSFLGHV